MGRTKALWPRKRVGNRFEEPLSTSSFAQFDQFAAPLSDSATATLFATNVNDASTPLPVSYSAFSTGGEYSSSCGASPAGAPSSMASVSSRPAPSLPFASLALPRSRDATNSSNSSVASASDAYRSRQTGDADGDAADFHDIEAREDQDSSDRESDAAEMITISRLELERWQQKVVFQVEDHFSNEQLKRIAEFGRVHASLLVEAKQYVYNVERQLNAQLEQERASLRAQAEAFVSKVSEENALLRARILTLERENAALRGNTVEDEDTDMSPPSVPASDECDQESAQSLLNNVQPLDPSAKSRKECDTPAHHKKHASDHLAIKSRDPLTPTADHPNGRKPVTVTPTGVNQVPELEAVEAPHEGSPSVGDASGLNERTYQPTK